MPFVNSYLSVENEKSRANDARERFKSLASKVVKEPVSTHICESRTREGKTRYLIVDRGVRPEDGCLILYAADNSFRVRRYEAEKTPIERVWGVVVWFLEEG